VHDKLFEFAPFVLDPAKRLLLRDGVPQTLTPKAFDVLVLLVEHRDRVVSKDELLRTLWPGTFVEEANLSQQIFLLRRLLNGGSTTPELIATIPRRGYRFVGSVVERRLAPAHIDVPAPIDAHADPSPQDARRRFSGWWVVAGLGAGLSVAALVYWMSGTTDPVPPRIIPVTTLEGLEGFPGISPDGRFVAFVRTGPDVESKTDIWITAVDGSALRQLTDTPLESEGMPAWSPDGRRIAFVREGRVMTASALGGDERHVADSGSMVGWTPDGRSLLVRDGVAPLRTFGISRLDLETGRRTPITRATQGAGDWTFDVSPDGRTLAFVRYDRPGVSDVYVVPIEGGQPQRRTAWGRNISRVAWTPDGRDLVFSVADPPALGDFLRRVPAFGAQPERGSRALHVNGMYPSMSRRTSGRTVRLAFHTQRMNSGLRLLDLDAPLTDGVLKSLGSLLDSSYTEVPGPFSKDAQQLSLVSDRSGWLQVWLANRDGSALRQVTNLEAAGLLPGTWSPDERQLVIDAAVNGNSDIYVVDLEDGRATPVTSEPTVETFPSWSYDGQWIYFSSDRSGTVQIWKTSPQGGQAIQVTTGGGIEPKEAIDGRALFYLNVNRPVTIRQVSPGGGDETIVLQGDIALHRWAVTRDGIVFVTIGQQYDSLDFYSFSDGRVRRLGRLPEKVSRLGGLGHLRVSADGRWALVGVMERVESDIMVAEGPW
jgi:Tol biopolymer transport system component/DNA-binding winged helix-turn-helix (wHTH) protein